MASRLDEGPSFFLALAIGVRHQLSAFYYRSGNLLTFNFLGPATKKLPVYDHALKQLLSDAGLFFAEPLVGGCKASDTSTQ